MTVEAEKQTNLRTLDKNKTTKEINGINISKNNEISKEKTSKKVQNGFVRNKCERSYQNGEINSLSKKKIENGENNAALNGKRSQELKTVDDDYFNILEGLDEEEEKRLRIESYLESLPQYFEVNSLDFDEIKTRKQPSDKSLKKKPSSDTRNNNQMNPYIMNNITLFAQKKNYSFNSYQLWKIKRDNEKIAEKLNSLEKRKISGDYVNSLKRIPSNAAVFRERNLRKIEAENKTIEHEIQRIKEGPNRKAPWYKTGSPWHKNNLEKNKKK